MSKKSNAITVKNNRKIEASKFSVPTTIEFPVNKIYTNQGTPKPTNMSNVLLPTALLTAISPLPLRATIIELRRSGTDVPPARIVSAMMTFGI